jgi:hypothetical protein
MMARMFVPRKKTTTHFVPPFMVDFSIYGGFPPFMVDFLHLWWICNCQVSFELGSSPVHVG